MKFLNLCHLNCSLFSLVRILVRINFSFFRCERQNYCEKKGASICPEGYNCKNMTTMHFVCAPTSSKVLEGPCLTSYDCMHNGVCLKSGKCDCKSPYKGSRCHEIEPCKDPSVCSSNGECISRSDTSEVSNKTQTDYCFPSISI